MKDFNKATCTRYAIKNKDTDDYAIEDGNSVYSLLEAYFFKTYQEALRELSTYDEPSKFNIIRVYLSITEEEVM